MDDLEQRTWDKRLNWRPNAQLSVDLFATHLGAPSVSWQPSFFLPWNVVFFAIALGVWAFLLTEKTVIQPLHWEWVAGI